MTTREVYNRMPEAVQSAIEKIRIAYKHEVNEKATVRAELYGYTKGLRDAGLISESERKILYVYGTV